MLSNTLSKLILSVVLVSVAFYGYTTISANSPQTETLHVGGLEIVARNPEVDLMVFKTPDDVERFCLSPAPDAVRTSEEGISMQGSARVTGTISAQEGDGGLSLGGRGQDVLIARELLYRACEAALNLNASKDETLALYKITLESIERITRHAPQDGAPGILVPQPDHAQSQAGAAPRAGSEAAHANDK